MEFPDQARFAFTILDDTDDSTIVNTAPIYDLLADLGFRTTKTVWALDSPPDLRGPYFAGSTLADSEYLAWVNTLDERGFEIAFHNASMGSAARAETIAALDLIESKFRLDDGLIHCNHGQNRENLYWGEHRYGLRGLSLAYRVLRMIRGFPQMDGHDPLSSYFWGDVSLARLAYVRGFAFKTLNCATIAPGVPYYDARKPLVSKWFNTADAPDAEAFKRLVTPGSVDELSRTGGWSIVSTHLGKGFCRGGRVDSDVEEVLRHVAALNGWFAPVGEVLRHVESSSGRHVLSRGERLRMELRHLRDRIGAG